MKKNPQKWLTNAAFFSKGLWVFQTWACVPRASRLDLEINKWWKFRLLTTGRVSGNRQDHKSFSEKQFLKTRVLPASLSLQSPVLFGLTSAQEAWGRGWAFLDKCLVPDWRGWCLWTLSEMIQENSSLGSLRRHWGTLQSKQDGKGPPTLSIQCLLAQELHIKPFTQLSTTI